MTNPAKTALARIAMTAIAMIDFNGEKGVATQMTTIGNAFSFDLLAYLREQFPNVRVG